MRSFPETDIDPICFSCLLGPTTLCAMDTFVLFSFIRIS